MHRLATVCERDQPANDVTMCPCDDVSEVHKSTVNLCSMSVCVSRTLCTLKMSSSKLVVQWKPTADVLISSERSLNSDAVTLRSLKLICSSQTRFPRFRISAHGLGVVHWEWWCVVQCKHVRAPTTTKTTSTTTLKCLMTATNKCPLCDLYLSHTWSDHPPTHDPSQQTPPYHLLYHRLPVTVSWSMLCFSSIIIWLFWGGCDHCRYWY